MQTIQIYVCDHCKFQSSDRNSVMKHEAEVHYQITLEQYKQWITLLKAAERAGAQRGISKNPKTDKEFDDRIQDLVEFEHKHNIFNKQPPNTRI